MVDKQKVKRFLRRFKYIVVVVVAVPLLTVIGENSLLQRYKYSRQISELQEELERQENQFLKDSLRLVELERHPEEIRKIARERYFMKADDEDIFILSDEIEGVEDETAE